MREDTRNEDQLQTISLVEDICDRYGPELSGDELEVLANALLKAHGPSEHYPHLLDERAPAGGRHIVVASLTDEAGSRMTHTRPAPLPESLPGAMELWATRLLAAARLRGRRRQVARLRLRGCAPAKIAGLLGVERSVVYLEWRFAKAALITALSSGAWDRACPSRITGADARELFRREQRKRVYHKPGHCPSGKEKCRRTGVCPYGN